MANTITIKSASYKGRYLQLECTQVENIENNTSTINWKLSSIGGSVNYYSTGPTTVTINGEKALYIERVSYTKEVFPAAKGSKTGSVTVPHNTDGTKSITVSLSTAIYDSTIKTVSEAWTLNALPRAAQLTGSPSFTDEENPTITYINYAGDAVTSLQACITFDGTQADIAYRDIPITGTSYTFSFTDEERRALRLATLEGSNKRTVYFKIKTVIGGVTYSDMSDAKTITIVNATPVLNPVAYDTSSKTLALTGNKNHIIKGFNSVYVEANATPKKGASITGYKISCGDQLIANPSGYFTNVETSNITFKVGDNRGLTAQVTPTHLTLIDYWPVTCGLSASIEITGETEATISLNITGAYFNGSFGAKDNNLQVSYAIKESQEDEFNDWIPIWNSTTYKDGRYTTKGTISNLNYLKGYTVKAMAVDQLGGAYSQEITLKAMPVFDWSDSDFNFNVPVSIGGVELDYIVERGNNASGWNYRKWNSGRAECWKTVEYTTAVDTAWGSLYCGTPLARQDYPFTFKSKPVEQATLQSGTYQGILFPDKDSYGVNTASATARYNVCRPSSVASSKFYLSFYVFGLWK